MEKETLKPRNLKEQVVKNTSDIEDIQEELDNVDIDLVSEKYDYLLQRDDEAEIAIFENREEINVNKANINTLAQVVSGLGEEVYTNSFGGTYPLSLNLGTQYLLNFGEYSGNSFSLNGGSFVCLEDIKEVLLQFAIPITSDNLNRKFDIYMSLNGINQGIVHSFTITGYGTFKSNFIYGEDLVEGDELIFNFRVENDNAVLNIAPSYTIEIVKFAPDRASLSSEVIYDGDSLPQNGINQKIVQMDTDIESLENEKVSNITTGDNYKTKITFSTTGEQIITITDLEDTPIKSFKFSKENEDNGIVRNYDLVSTLSEKTYLYNNTENTGSVVDISESVYNFKFISLVIYDNVNNKRNVSMFPTSELEPNDTFEMNGLTITYLNPTSLQLNTATDFHIIKVVGEIRINGGTT